MTAPYLNRLECLALALFLKLLNAVKMQSKYSGLVKFDYLVTPAAQFLLLLKK